MRPASWPMSRPRLYHGPTAPLLLAMLADMSRIVDHAIDGGIIGPEVWATFMLQTGIDVGELREAVEIELADHGYYHG